MCAGILEGVPDTYSNISLSWSTQGQEFEQDDNIRRGMYDIAVDQTLQGLMNNHWAFQNPFLISAVLGFNTIYLIPILHVLLFVSPR